MTDFIIPYKLSKDYDKLFQLICENNKVAAFVDYKPGKEFTECRDICTIKRFNERGDIQISSRGIGYGGVYEIDVNKNNEKDLFIDACKSLNLEWIE